jgi:hypothetical protein
MSYVSEGLHAYLTQRTQRKEEKSGESGELRSSLLCHVRYRNLILETTSCVGSATRNRKSLLFAVRIGENRFTRMVSAGMRFKGESA